MLLTLSRRTASKDRLPERGPVFLWGNEQHTSLRGGLGRRSNPVLKFMSSGLDRHAKQAWLAMTIEEAFRIRGRGGFRVTLGKEKQPAPRRDARGRFVAGKKGAGAGIRGSGKGGTRDEGLETRAEGKGKKPSPNADPRSPNAPSGEGKTPLQEKLSRNDVAASFSILSREGRGKGDAEGSPNAKCEMQNAPSQGVGGKGSRKFSPPPECRPPNAPSRLPSPRQIEREVKAVLTELMRGSDSDTIRIAAAKALMEKIGKRNDEGDALANDSEERQAAINEARELLVRLASAPSGGVRRARQVA